MRGIVLSGLVADRIGRRPLLAICALLIALFSAMTPFLLGGGVAGQTVFILVGFGLLGLSFGQASGAVTSNFSSQYRYTGAALTSDLVVAHRRRVRAAGGAGSVQPVRAGLGRRLPALGRGLHPGLAPVQQAGDAGRVRLRRRVR